jgi:acyl-CoA hydrolase
MEINEVNKKLYESAFVSDGTFGDLDNWKPDIDERMIEESCEDENGNWIPATPLGYRDYKLSREEGLNTVFHESVSSRVFTLEEVHNIKKEDNIIKKYDLITIDKNNYIVTGDDETKFYVVDKDDHKYYIEYQL